MGRLESWLQNWKAINATEVTESFEVVFVGPRGGPVAVP